MRTSVMPIRCDTEALRFVPPGGNVICAKAIVPAKSKKAVMGSLLIMAIFDFQVFKYSAKRSVKSPFKTMVQTMLKFVNVRFGDKIVRFRQVYSFVDQILMVVGGKGASRR